MENSVQKVFAIPELLELILLQLPFLDLVRAQMVSGSFYDVIESSTPLQQALFLRASPATSIPIPNPLLQPCANAQFLDLRSTHIRCRYIHDPRGRRRNDFFQWPTIASRCDSKLKVDFTNKAVRRSEASWRRMLIVQPPVAQLEINGPQARNIEDNLGITMHELGSPLSKLKCVDFEIFTSGLSRMVVEKPRVCMAR